MALAVAATVPVAKAIPSPAPEAGAIPPENGAAGAWDLRPISPARGATVGARPVFRFRLRTAGEAVGSFTLELSADRWKTVHRAWGIGPNARGRRDSEGPGGTEVAVLCPEPLPEGTWEWRVRLPVFESAPPLPEPFRVDDTPPAAVEGLTLARLHDGSVELRWQPVTRDVEGKPEAVDRYVVYRYSGPGTFPQSARSRIGESRVPHFMDRAARRGEGEGERPDAAGRETAPGGPGATGMRAPGAPGSTGSRVGYYKVTAVDAAGNELGVREPAR